MNILTAMDKVIIHTNKYNVVWDAPSKDYNGSIPLGNGDIGLNAWVEKNGALVLYISKTDSWGGNARLLKVDRVQINLAFGKPKEICREVNEHIKQLGPTRYIVSSSNSIVQKIPPENFLAMTSAL